MKRSRMGGNAIQDYSQKHYDDNELSGPYIHGRFGDVHRAEQGFVFVRILKCKSISQVQGRSDKSLW